MDEDEEENRLATAALACLLGGGIVAIYGIAFKLIYTLLNLLKL